MITNFGQKFRQANPLKHLDVCYRPLSYTKAVTSVNWLKPTSCHFV